MGLAKLPPIDLFPCHRLKRQQHFTVRRTTASFFGGPGIWGMTRCPSLARPHSSDSWLSVPPGVQGGCIHIVPFSLGHVPKSSATNSAPLSRVAVLSSVSGTSHPVGPGQSDTRGNSFRAATHLDGRTASDIAVGNRFSGTGQVDAIQTQSRALQNSQAEPHTQLLLPSKTNLKHIYGANRL